MISLKMKRTRKMLPQKIWLLTACTTILSMMPTLAGASSLTFNLPYGQRKCFSEEVPPSATVRGAVHVASGRGDMTLDMFVSDSHGTVHFHKSDINSVKFSFRTPATNSQGVYAPDDYRFCVVNQVHPQAAASPGVIRRITLDVTHMSDRHSAEVDKLAKDEHAEKIFTTFSTVSSEVDEIIEKLDELRAKEQDLTELNENTASTILTISVLASFFTIATGFVNFFSLKSFFKRKKLA